MKKYLPPAAIACSFAALMTVASCSREADVASRNLSYAADRFEVNRRIIFVNGITDKYLMVIEGLCALGNMDKPRELTVTCKTGPTDYKKHFLGVSDNVTYVVEQLEPAKTNVFRYRVDFRPTTIIPDINLSVPN